MFFLVFLAKPYLPFFWHLKNKNFNSRQCRQHLYSATTSTLKLFGRKSFSFWRLRECCWRHLQPNQPTIKLTKKALMQQVSFFPAKTLRRPHCFWKKTTWQHFERACLGNTQCSQFLWHDEHSTTQERKIGHVDKTLSHFTSWSLKPLKKVSGTNIGVAFSKTKKPDK